MKNCQKINCIVFVLAIIFAAILPVAAQQLKPTEIIYSRLQTDLQAAPTGANQPTIWAVGQDGSNDRKICNGMQPRISDDGRFLLYKKFPGTPNNPYGNPWGADGQLWVRDLANNSETMILSWGNTYQLGYYFSPFSNQGNYEIVLAYGSLLYKMNRDGTGATALEYYFGTGVPREGDNFPVLRRDDSRIVADSRDGGLVTRTPGSEPPVNIPNTAPSDYNPSWSNDNQFVGFSTIFPLNANPFNANPPYPYVFGKLGKIKPDGTGKIQLADLTNGGNTDGIAFGTIWTDDNSKIIAAARIGGVASLYAFNTDGSGGYARIPISNGNAPDFVGGIVQPRVEERLISSAGGVMTDQNGNFGSQIEFFDQNQILVNQYSMLTAIGEPVAGGNMSGGGFSFQTGLIANPPAAPTAANVSIGGRVLVGKKGLARARVNLVDSSGAARASLTNSFGYYRFDNVAAGETYLMSVFAKNYQFSPQIVTVMEDFNELNFTALP